MKDVFVRIKYYEETDEFRLETKTKSDTEWDMVLSCKCMEYKGQTYGEPEMVHYSILTKLMQMIGLGCTYSDI